MGVPETLFLPPGFFCCLILMQCCSRELEWDLAEPDIFLSYLNNREMSRRVSHANGKAQIVYRDKLTHCSSLVLPVLLLISSRHLNAGCLSQLHRWKLCLPACAYNEASVAYIYSGSPLFDRLCVCCLSTTVEKILWVGRGGRRRMRVIRPAWGNYCSSLKVLFDFF